MAEHDNDTATVAPRGRGTDLVTLIAGLATLLVSAYILSDGQTWLPGVDLRWILAGGAVLVGVLMLAASMRGDRGQGR
ncbi:hypothetical protein B0I33_113191 [Prauserella shujinwangii]|uniref:Uncharacterized protein n=1 Tax=Prauserella shujinwangii TaxID=1453103 RepID=A0A2T0LLW3_9PSEU|nr:hypothetical protein [Prauserella shujinwangii]PRX44025.1 hypothetical protein B0I33_113191 [Prauserella shujinwangii]